MGVFRRLVQEQVLDDDAFHRGEARRDVLGVRIGLGDVFALHIESLEAAADRVVEHVGNAQALLGIELDTPELLEHVARRVVRNMAVTGELVRERAHVAGALDIVLAAQRVHADALAPDIARRHGDVGHAHDHGRALAVLGDAEAIEDRAVAAGGVEPGRGAQIGRRHAGVLLARLRRIALLGDEAGPDLEIGEVAALADVILVDQSLGDDDMGDGVDQRAIGAGLEREMVVGLDMWRLDHIDPPGVGDDHLRALADALLHPGGEDRVAVGRVGADDQDDVGLLDRFEVLRAGRGAERGLQAVAGRRVADAGAGVDIVVAEAGAHQLLDEIDLLIGAARRGDGADRLPAILGLDALELAGGVVDRLLPRDLAPGIGDLLADHRLGHAVLVGRIAPGKAALDTGVAFVRLAVLVGHHAHDAVALHLGLERAADAAIGAGRDLGMLGLAELYHLVLHQRRGRAGLHAGAAGDAFGAEKIGRSRGDARVEAAAGDRQREGALHLGAGAHAAIADDALAGIVGEIGVRGVLG